MPDLLDVLVKMLTPPPPSPHDHICPKCGTHWHHDPAEFKDETDYKSQHRCPKVKRIIMGKEIRCSGESWHRSSGRKPGFCEHLLTRYEYPGAKFCVDCGEKMSGR